MTTKKHLAEVAKDEAMKFYHGFVMTTEPNIGDMVRLFPNWTLEEADACWCAAFVYHCCVLAGFEIPVRPKESISCTLAGCPAWEELAQGDRRIEYRPADSGYTPEAGDIVLFDKVFCDAEHDHIGIVCENRPETIVVAEGNINNVSGVIERRKDGHIRAYISLPDGFSYRH